MATITALAVETLPRADGQADLARVLAAPASEVESQALRGTRSPCAA